GLLRVRGLALALALPVTVASQTVRGTVTERSDVATAPGAIVILERLVGDSVRERNAVLSDERGAFTVRSTLGGAFILSVRRIGSVPFRSERFNLRVGEARAFDVQLE